MRPEYAAELRARLRPGGIWVEPTGADVVRGGGTWDGGPIDALLLRRELVPDEVLGPALGAWTMHCAPHGFLALEGWASGDGAAPHVHAWMLGARLWVPVFYDGFFMIFQNVGLLSDT